METSGESSLGRKLSRGSVLIKKNLELLMIYFEEMLHKKWKVVKLHEVLGSRSDGDG